MVDGTDRLAVVRINKRSRFSRYDRLDFNSAGWVFRWKGTVWNLEGKPTGIRKIKAVAGAGDSEPVFCGCFNSQFRVCAKQKTTNLTTGECTYTFSLRPNSKQQRTKIGRFWQVWVKKNISLSMPWICYWITSLLRGRRDGFIMLEMKPLWCRLHIRP